MIRYNVSNRHYHVRFKKYSEPKPPSSWEEAALGTFDTADQAFDLFDWISCNVSSYEYGDVRVQRCDKPNCMIRVDGRAKAN